LKYIDLEKHIANSESAFLKRIPRFIVKLLIKLVRQEELNGIINRNAQYNGVDFIKRAFEEFNVDLKIEGKENLPESGRCFFVANHPFGFMEGLALTTIVAGKYGDLKAIGNDVYNLIPNLESVIAVVNVFGRNPRDYITALEKVYQSDSPITHFPAGEVSRVYKGKIQDCEWQKSFITKAISCKRSVVPFYFYGRNSLLFYSVGLFRKLFGIKMNLELALIPNELFWKKNKSIRLKIGKPIPSEVFDKSRTHHEWAQWVRGEVYALRGR
jgi:putative hemolysin